MQDVIMSGRRQAIGIGKHAYERDIEIDVFRLDEELVLMLVRSVENGITTPS